MNTEQAQAVQIIREEMRAFLADNLSLFTDAVKSATYEYLIDSGAKLPESTAMQLPGRAVARRTPSALAPNGGRAWSRDEDGVLRTLMRTKTIPEMAELLGRTTASLERRLVTLGINVANL